jgi:hypothetical protein
MAALDAYADRGIAREQGRQTPPPAVQVHGTNNQKRNRLFGPRQSAKPGASGLQGKEAALAAAPNVSNEIRDTLAAELTDLAYPLALRQGVQGFSVDVELDIWKAIYGTLQEMPDPTLINASEIMRLWEDALARLTEAAYKVALLRGFRGTFVDFELRLWDAFHEELPSSFLMPSI